MTEKWVLFAFMVVWAIILVFIALPMALYTLSNERLFNRYTNKIASKLEVIYVPIRNINRSVSTHYRRWVSRIRGNQISNLQIKEQEIRRKIIRSRTVKTETTGNN